MGRQDYETETETVIVTHALRGEGFDASEDGTGRGTPLVPVAVHTTGAGFWQEGLGTLRAREQDSHENLIALCQNGSDIQISDISSALTSGVSRQTSGPLIAYRTAGDGAVYEEGDRTAPLTTSTDPHTNIIAFSCKDHGADAGDTAPTLRAMGHNGSHANAGGQVAVAFRASGQDGFIPENVSPPVLSSDGGGAGVPTVAIQNATRGQDQNGLGISEDDVMYTLDQASQHAVVTPYTLAIRGRGDSHNLEYRQDGTANAILTPNGGRGGIGVGAVAISGRARGDDGRGYDRPEHFQVEVASTLDGVKVDRVLAPAAMAVRRLTPKECERLQGFYDDYTLVTHRNKDSADGPRYKALGNSMAVPCMKWIGERIQMVDAL